METPFKAVEFAKHQTVTRDLLDTVQNNNQWLKDNTPRARNIFDDGTSNDTLTVLICGRFLVPRNKTSENFTGTVGFASAFDPRCIPNITTGIISESARQIHAAVGGPRRTAVPNASGFDIHIAALDAAAGTKARRWKIAKGFYIHWQAMGYRTDDMLDYV